MNKATKIITLVGATASLLTISFLAESNGSLLSAFSAVNNSTWVHYSKKEATSSSKGIREYWVQCGGSYQFEKPTTGTIKEATSYDLSGFTSNDPRYIFYIASSKSVFYLESTSTYNYTEASELSGYTVNDLPTSLGVETRVEFYKNDSSPMYSANVMRVTDTIDSKDDLKTLQTDIYNNDVLSGYYVLTTDLSSPSTYVNKNGDHAPVFGATFDGRGHTINNPVFWGLSMLGDTDGATVKNLNFTGIRVFQCLAWHFNNSTLDNVNFTLGENPYNVGSLGLICGAIEGDSKIKDCTIDFGESYLFRSDGSLMAPIAQYNSTPSTCDLFENTIVKCLGSVNIFLIDACGRSLRPTYSGLTYVTTYQFINNGKLNYSLKYLSGNDTILTAAKYIQSAIYRITGKTMTMTSFTSTETFDKDTPNIVIGSDASLEAVYETAPTEDGGYFVKTIGKAIYINAHDDYAYQSAILAFLEQAFGYESFYKERLTSVTKFTNTVEDPNNIDTFCLNINTTSPFKYRRCDAGEGYFMDQYSYGYTNRGYTSDDIYFDIPGISTDTYMYADQRFHTTTILLYPGTYLSTHKKWFMSSILNVYDDPVNNSYIRYQLCFTAHGDEDEYDEMVETTATKIEEGYANRSSNQQAAHVFCLGIGDNDYYCDCYYCRQANKKYGARSGAMIKYVNDVQDKLDEYYGERVIDLWTLAYDSFSDAPIDDDGNATITSKASIMVAPISSNFTHPINDTTYNEDAYNMFEEWSKVGKISSWLYEANFTDYLYPYNSWEAMTQSIAYMATKGVDLAYVEGQHNLTQYPTGFNQLKVYLKGKFMANPFTSNYTQLVNKFFTNYYGEGSTELRTFFNELVDRMSTFDTNSTYSDILYADGTKSINSKISNKGLWDQAQLERWNTLAHTAYNKATDSEIKKHCLAESIFPQWALVTLFADEYDDSTLLQMRKDFKEDADTLLITLTKESGTNSDIQTYYDAWGI